MRAHNYEAFHFLQQNYREQHRDIYGGTTII